MLARTECDQPSLLSTYPAAEAALSHHTGITTVTGPPGLGAEHVVVVALVVPVSEALGAQRHALRDPAGLTPEGHKVCGPDEAAHDGVVVLLHVVAEVVRGAAAAHQPPTPVHSIAVIDILLRVQEVVQQSLENVGYVIISPCYFCIYSPGDVPGSGERLATAWMRMRSPHQSWLTYILLEQMQQLPSSLS